MVFRRIIAKFVTIAIQRLSFFFSQRGKVFMFHNIGRPIDEFCIGKEEFECFLKYIKTHKVIRLEEWENAMGFHAITVDDVYEGFYNNGYPLLKEYNIPFTIFVNASLVGTAGYISEGQLKDMSSCSLCTVGSHGYSHDLYAKLSISKADEDLNKSKMFIERIVGKEVSLFAFPYGSYYACGFRNKHLVSSYYKYGFGTIKCPITTPLFLPKYFLPRINVDSKYILSHCKNEKS